MDVFKSKAVRFCNSMRVSFASLMRASKDSGGREESLGVATRQISIGVALKFEPVVSLMILLAATIEIRECVCRGTLAWSEPSPFGKRAAYCCDSKYSWDLTCVEAVEKFRCAACPVDL